MEIAADRQEIGIYIPEIAADMAGIAHDMQAIAGCSPATRISFMEAGKDSFSSSSSSSKTPNTKSLDCKPEQV